ncbi:radical SAM protein [Natranaerobius thermophilus]|uniref:Radical SAM domain protein n=1 Tax=Natranaerobius thermophilus (strain ATCC BAA-1301 / DSM 18059 / JW/NM-WN-LF) TaxID=457570 RepID=B2A6E0_NATTJ|nr:radical SAM protein [Natranaerobius thermophilus]ACB84151.1 Radical SAM domain protein [Natranaerobius thermophilus JW/NM-WN-LF]
MNYKKLIGSAVINQGLNYIEKDPLNNIPKLLKYIKKFTAFDHHHKAIDNFGKAIEDPDNNWNQLTQKVLNNYDMNIVKKFVANFVLNSVILGRKVSVEYSEKYDCNVPWAILMDPTAACNLKCEGCWAADYDKTSMSFETMDRIIREGKELGVYMYVFSGGEPFLKKQDLIKLAGKHNDCAFLSFTNGTLIDEELAKDLSQVGNFALAISVDGFEAVSDQRRGEGTYSQIDETMGILSSYGVPFGFSTTYHRYNTETVASEEYIDAMVDKGCLFGWYFTYMPIGKQGTPDMLVTPEQRAYMFEQIHKFRAEKPIFLIDFWNDGEFSGGCIAGGRNYLHINANGDVEPCAFIHYANVNIHDHSLLEALRSPLFQEYRKRQPFDDNLLKPCPLLDNPDILTEMVQNSDAYSTQILEKEPVERVANKCQPIASKWARKADELWEENYSVSSESD